MKVSAPRPPTPGTQEARILAILEDGRPHTLYDWPADDTYTGRNAVSRLVKRGYRIKAWYDRRHKTRRGKIVKTYQLQLEQAELPLEAAR